MHQVDDDGLITLEVILPAIFCILLVIKAFRFNLWDYWLLLDAIQVFVKPIEQEVQELLRVLLIIIIEIACETADSLLKLPGCQGRQVIVPKLFEELRVCDS